jgi:predicted nucleotide-binding protein
MKNWGGLMKTFRGTIDEFKNIISMVGLSGKWSEISNGYQFKANNGAILNWYSKTGTIQYQGKEYGKIEIQDKLNCFSSATIKEKEAIVTNVSQSIEEEGNNFKIFVVHGHDTTAREQLELILHKLDIEPFVLANTGGNGLTIIEELEREIGQEKKCERFGIVLLTPDDFGYSKEDGQAKIEPRARQNVVLEMGMLIAAFGRENVAILKKGHLEVPSDASGILYLPFNEHVKETVPRLVNRLQKNGFPIKSENIVKATS